jgi:soluble lytic murein transglycosylase-like protein
MQVDAIFKDKIESIQQRLNARMTAARMPSDIFASKLNEVMGNLDASGVLSTPEPAPAKEERFLGAALAGTASLYRGGLLETSFYEGANKNTNDKSKYDDIINAAAAKTGLPADLIRAVIRTESSFNKNAVSRAGAQGLMQLMPGTARSLGVTDPFDPEQNINAGASYLKKQLDRFQDVRLALAAYNTGPGRVAALHISDAENPVQYHKISQGVRGYVDKVLGYYYEYQGT